MNEVTTHSTPDIIETAYFWLRPVWDGDCELCPKEYEIRIDLAREEIMPLAQALLELERQYVAIEYAKEMKEA
jgi:hypothetical protein